MTSTNKLIEEMNRQRNKERKKKRKEKGKITDDSYSMTQATADQHALLPCSQGHHVTIAILHHAKHERD
jgi:hypothetical protein